MARSRSSTSALARLLDKSPNPVYALDEQRRIIFCNSACSEWTGTTAAELVGVRCDFRSSQRDGGLADIAARLCPPPEAFAGQRVRAELMLSRAGSEPTRRWAEFLPLIGDDQEIVGVIAFVYGQDATGEPPADGSFPSSIDDMHARLLELRREIAWPYRLDRLLGESAVMRRVRDQVRLAIESRGRVLIVGPPGSGRQHVARTIYYGDGPETPGSLVPVNCSLVDAELLQATVTHAKRIAEPSSTSRPPALLLLEADQLPPDAQFELAGFFGLPNFQMQTIATASQNLMRLADQGEYRRDLALLLSTLVIELPPLSSRPEDVPLLAQLFLEEFNAVGGKQLSRFTDDALDRLAAYSWPGNMDEMCALIGAACEAAEGPAVSVADLPKKIHMAAEAAAFSRKSDETIVLDEFLAEIERELIERALRRAKGNKTKAAELLGVTRARLHRRLPQLGLDNDKADDAANA